MVGRPSERSKSGREILPQVRKWSGDPPGHPKVLGRHPGMSESGRETRLEVWKLSQTLREVLKWSRDPLVVRKWSGDHP